MNCSHRFAQRLTLTLAALACTVAPAFGSPAPELSFAKPRFDLAQTCVLTSPIAYVHAKVRNPGAVSAPAGTLTASDDARALYGEAGVPAIAPGKTAHVDIPLSLDTRPDPEHPPAGAASIAGSHTFTLAYAASGSASTATKAFSTSIAPKFCSTAIADMPKATPPPRPPSPNPLQHKTLVARPRNDIVTALAISPPDSTTSVKGLTDCRAHVSYVDAVLCQTMIESGDLLLIWKWTPLTAITTIDGFHVYELDGSVPKLTTTVAGAKTLATIPVPAGGYAGRCYAVKAYAGQRESAFGNTFCFAPGSIAVTTVLRPIFMRSAERTKDKQATFDFTRDFRAAQFTSTDYVVGHFYTDTKSIVGDSYVNTIDRTAFDFDVSSLTNRSIVSAILRFTIDKSFGDGNNHSCVNDIGTGIEFWWKPDAATWIDGAFGFGIAPTDEGPVVGANVTAIVTAWSTGRVNYGFVLRNEDENLNAFTHAQCQTSYTNPTLEIVHY